MLCVLFDVLSLAYAVCIFRCVVCDRMVCVLLVVMIVNVWYVYCSLC